MLQNIKEGFSWHFVIKQTLKFKEEDFPIPLEIIFGCQDLATLKWPPQTLTLKRKIFYSFGDYFRLAGPGNIEMATSHHSEFHL
jgi:hypothetical protein